MSQGEHPPVGSNATTAPADAADTIVALPYFAPSDQLPAPLPTDHDIKYGPDTEVLKGYDHYNERTVRVGQHFVVKYNTTPELLEEGRNMIYVREVCDIVIPRVYALYTKPGPNALYTKPGRNSCDIHYMVMEYIPSQSLQTCWERLSEEQKSAVTQKLKLILQKLRSVPSHGYIGAFGRRPMMQDMVPLWDTMGRFATDEVRPEIKEKLGRGPYANEAELHKTILEQWKVYESRHVTPVLSEPMGVGVGAFTSELIEKFALDKFNNHPTVLTHGAISPGRILLKDDGTVVLIGWELAGWYPSYQEYATAWPASRKVHGFYKCIRGALEAYREEFILYWKLHGYLVGMWGKLGEDCVVENWVV